MNKSRLAMAIAATAISVASVSHAADYEVTVTNLSAGIHITPLIVSAHPSSASMFDLAAPVGAEMQAIAEGGDTSGMAALLESIGASVSLGSGLIEPGATATLELAGGNDANSVLSVTGMLLPTNDGFVGLNSVALPENEGDTVRYFARSYDAGTEANNEILGSGAPGEAGFPAPPPVVATGTGTGGTGINAPVEGFVTVHRGVLGDLDSTGGASDINAAIHQWSDPIALISVKMIGEDMGNDITPVMDLSGLVYSKTAVELFWKPTNLAGSITGYEVTRNGELVETRHARGYFDDSLQPNTEYTYVVRPFDAEGNRGPEQSVTLTTNP